MGYFKFRVRKFMKLFKSLLVAPATLGLLAPMYATANEVTINDFNPAEELAVTNSRVDGLEARLNNFEAGSFSSTSFAGEDSLDVAIDAGQGSAALTELDLNANGDALTVDGITYTFPVGDELTVLVGDSTSGSALYSTACVYGGFTNTLDDCGNFNSAFVATGHADSVGFSAAY